MAQVNEIEDVLLKAPEQPNGCWEWKGATTNTGYGKVTVNYKTWLAHRYVYEYVNGEIPKHLELDHLCCNKLCINPEHLEAVTQKENMRRRYANQTHCKHGHPLSGDNLYIDPRNKRGCKTCRRLAVRRWSK